MISYCRPDACTVCRPVVTELYSSYTILQAMSPLTGRAFLHHV